MLNSIKSDVAGRGSTLQYKKLIKSGGSVEAAIRDPGRAGLVSKC